MYATRDRVAGRFESAAAAAATTTCSTHTVTHVRITNQCIRNVIRCQFDIAVSTLDHTRRYSTFRLVKYGATVSPFVQTNRWSRLLTRFDTTGSMRQGSFQTDNTHD